MTATARHTSIKTENKIYTTKIPVQSRDSLKKKLLRKNEKNTQPNIRNDANAAPKPEGT